MHFCNMCEEHKPEAMMTKYTPRSACAGRVAPRCKSCAALKMRAWKFTLDLDELRDMLLRGCEACGATDDLHIDHDHACCPSRRKSCGECVRGVLCGPCNLALGHLNEDPVRMAALAAYIGRFD